MRVIMRVIIYADSTGLFTDDFIDEHSNLCYVEINELNLKDYFNEEIRPILINNISFDEWLNEYTADDTTDLWEWCNRFGIECRIDSFF